MVHDLKDPLCCGLLRNVRINIKQWGVIMSQKLYLFNDLEKPANFIGDLRFYEVRQYNNDSIYYGLFISDETITALDFYSFEIFDISPDNNFQVYIVTF